jgi:hypothetical protein
MQMLIVHALDAMMTREGQPPAQSAGMQASLFWHRSAA